MIQGHWRFAVTLLAGLGILSGLGCGHAERAELAAQLAIEEQLRQQQEAESAGVSRGAIQTAQAKAFEASQLTSKRR